MAATAIIAVPIVDQDDDRDILDQNCVICTKPLFSTGQRVVKIRQCQHHLHQCCLERSFRTRAAAADEHDRRRCPECNHDGDNNNGGEHHRRLLVMDPVSCQATFDAVLSERNPHGYNGPAMCTARAKELAQYMLWSNISSNVELLLNDLRAFHFPKVTFQERFRVTRESGMIQVIMRIIIEKGLFHYDAKTLEAALRLLRYCMEFGSREESIALATENMDGFYETVLGKAALMELDTKGLVMPLVRMFSSVSPTTATASQKTLSRESVVRFQRIIPGVVKTLKDSPDCKMAQLGGCEFLRYACAEDACVPRILDAGGLMVLYEAHKKHKLTTADETLQHLLSLNLRL